MNEPIKKNYKITLISGLHIGGTQDGLKIGGIDSSVIKNPLTGEPYIPGSTIKGKMRAMLEMVEYSDALEGLSNIGPIQDPNHIIARSFGCATQDAKIASRLIFEDFVLIDESEREDGIGQQTFEDKKSEFFEDKSENSIPRFLSGSANPRHIERVPAGVCFQGNIILLPEEGNYDVSQVELEEILKKGIDLLNKTYLGGGGSRGNGRINMELIE